MRLALLLIALQQPAASLHDSTYATPALRAFIATASASNHAAPLTLRGYAAHVETEVALVLRDSIGRELTGQVEQFASAATWQRDGRYELHVVGYRTVSSGAPFSALTLLGGWTVPVLYGERLDAGIATREGPASRRSVWGTPGAGGNALDTLHTVHPLAADRDAYYTFTGGDTVAVIRTATDTIRIVRVHVTPIVDRVSRLGRFAGDLDFDAESHALVRMRGRLMYTGPPPAKRPLITRMPGLVAAAYIELVNARVGRDYWLPSYQRSELQASAALLGDERSIFRIVSRFSDYRVQEQPADSALSMVDTSVPNDKRRLTFAPDDTLSAYRAWERAPGAASSAVDGDDFIDVAPAQWRPSQGLSFNFFPRRLGEVFHFNRVEGAFTGVSVGAKMPTDAGPFSARATAAWAWTERTVRGALSASLDRGTTTYGARVERTLASTNDFRFGFGDDLGLGALFGGMDDADYVDRRIATMSLVRRFAPAESRGLAAYVVLEGGAADDRGESARLTHGFISRSTPFLPNRGSADGRYARFVETLVLHPNADAISLESGLGVTLRNETAAGELAYDRAELRISARKLSGDFALSSGVDAGYVTGAHIPPQQLFELGGREGLAGYDYKVFAGDETIRASARAGYTLPLWRRPVRVWRYFVPGLSPGAALELSGAHADILTLAARNAISSLGATPEPRAANGVRATASAFITFFSGALGVGVARPIDNARDRRDGWRFVFEAGLGD